MLKNRKLLQVAREYADKCHSETNHLYDGKPYADTHCKLVVDWGYRFIFLVKEDEAEVVLSALWGHDIEEDTRQTYNDIRKVLGKEVADIIHALTNEKGKNRAERANDKYYKMKRVPNAVFCKLCDRLANIQYSKETNSKMLDAYRKEHSKFLEALYDETYTYMFKEMADMLGIEYIKPKTNTRISLRKILNAIINYFKNI